MPMLWKSILHKDKPGYSSNYSRSQFEMMSGSNKRSRSATHNAESAHYEENGSDENILIPDGKSYVTTKVRAGDGVEGSVGEESTGGGTSLDDSHILRTVEVTRVYESN